MIKLYYTDPVDIANVIGGNGLAAGLRVIPYPPANALLATPGAPWTGGGYGPLGGFPGAGPWMQPMPTYGYPAGYAPIYGGYPPYRTGYPRGY